MIGNPLVAGFQEDLAPDDEFKTSDRSIINVVLRAEVSSDEDASTSAFKSSSRYKDSLTARSSITSVSKSGFEALGKQVRETSGETRANPVAIPDVMVDSSEDEMAGSGVVVRQDDDISEEELDSEQQKVSHISV